MFLINFAELLPSGRVAQLELALDGRPLPGCRRHRAFGLAEHHEDHAQIHVIRNWCYLGSAKADADAKNHALGLHKRRSARARPIQGARVD